VIFAALLFLGITALVGGVVLSLSSQRLQAQMNPLVHRIERELPGVNCGECGHPLCGVFARLVADGREKPGGCIPGGHATSVRITAIMGNAPQETEALMAVVHCKGGHAEARVRSRYSGIPDCHAAMLSGNGSLICQEACLGLGSCVRACPYGAIAITENGIAAVNPALCTGCGRCVAACPRSLIELIPRLHKIFLGCNNRDHGSRVSEYCSVGCTTCGICVEATRASSAISIDDNIPRLDYAKHENFITAAYKCPQRCFIDTVRARPKVNIDTKCDGCTACVPVCPVEAISGEKSQRHIVNKEKCIGCGICLGVCHVHAIALWGGLAYRTEGLSLKRR